MLCNKPYRKGNAEFGCGQCMPCRFNRRRLWTARLLLEATQHENKSFITLTYNDKNAPKDHSLDPSHYKNFIKRLRKAIYPKKIRYYLVGEYGDHTQRPHYHAALFGLSLPLGLMELEKRNQLNLFDNKQKNDSRCLEYGKYTCRPVDYSINPIQLFTLSKRYD